MKRALKATLQSFDPDAAATGEGIYGLPFAPEESTVIIVPVPFEATTSYGGGTAGGPEAIRIASRQVDLHDPELRQQPYERGIALLPISPDVVRWNSEAQRYAQPIIEAGGRIDGNPLLKDSLEKVNAIGDSVNAWVHDQTARILGQGKMVFTLGGDHSVPFGAIQAYAEKYTDFSILHIDAHCDLREAYEGFTWSHASIFYNVIQRIPKISLVQVGVRDLGMREAALAKKNPRITLFRDSEMARDQFNGVTWDNVARKIESRLRHFVYVSVDIDGLDPSLCPNTGTPVVGGLSFNQFVHLLRVISEHHTIVGGDLCEVAPGKNGDEKDASVGARVLYKMIGYALKSQPIRG